MLLENNHSLEEYIRGTENPTGSMLEQCLVKLRINRSHSALTDTRKQTNKGTSLAAVIAADTVSVQG